MADEAQKTEEPDTKIRFTKSFVRSPGGVLIAINLVLLTIGWILMSAQRSETGSNWSMSFYLFATVMSWFFWITMYILMLFNIISKITCINWPFSLLINAGVDSLLLLVSSILVLIYGIKWGLGMMIGASVFGLLASTGLAIEAYFHFKDRND